MHKFIAATLFIAIRQGHSRLLTRCSRRCRRDQCESRIVRWLRSREQCRWFKERVEVGRTPGRGQRRRFKRVEVGRGGTAGGAQASALGTPIGSIAAPRPAADTRAAVAPSRSGRSDISLPRNLMPDGLSWGFALQAPLRAIPGTPNSVVRICVQAIERAAMPYGVVRVDAASSGPLRRQRHGTLAPLRVRIQYARQGGVEVRQARVSCRLDAAGGVIDVI